MRWSGLTLKYSTGIKVNPKDWDFKKQRITELKKIVVRNENEKTIKHNEEQKRIEKLNILLTNKVNTIENLFNDYLYQNNSEPTSTKEFKKIIDSVFKTVTTTNNSFYGAFNEFKESKQPKTKSWYDNTYNTLIKFKPKLDYEDIDLVFYNQFVKHLEEKNLGKNTIAKHIQNLKAFLNWATDNQLNSNLIFRTKAFKKETEKSDNIALTNDEVNKIFNLDLTDNPKLDNVRDLFIVGSRTGLRFSDFNKVALENIKGNFIEIETFKTSTDVVIPIHPQVKKIINKYKGVTSNSLPNPIANQNFNKYIKEVCELVEGMKTIEIVIATIGGKRTETKTPRFKRVSSHTCRRTYITLNYEMNVPVTSIMSSTGHKSTEFIKYIKSNSKKHAEIIASYWENE
jgi:integrase